MKSEFHVGPGFSDEKLDESRLTALKRVETSLEASYKILYFLFDRFPDDHPAKETTKRYKEEILEMILAFDEARNRTRTFYQCRIEMWRSDAYRISTVANFFLNDLQKLGLVEHEELEAVTRPDSRESIEDPGFGENLSMGVCLSSPESPMHYIENDVTDV